MKTHLAISGQCLHQQILMLEAVGIRAIHLDIACFMMKPATDRYD